MSVLSAERSFKQGRAAMADARHAEAAEHFRTAIQIEKEHAVCEPNARYLSYYGLSLAMERGRALPVDIDACERIAAMCGARFRRRVLDVVG